MLPLYERPMRNYKEFTEYKKRNKDEEIMLMVLQQAEKAKLDGDFPVGASLVWLEEKVFDCDTVYAEGDNTNHAVMNVIRKASQTLNRPLTDAVLYTNLEPCLMCASAAYFNGIHEIVFGAHDIKNGFISSNLLVDHTVFDMQHKGGVLVEKCIDIIPKEYRKFLK